VQAERLLKAHHTRQEPPHIQEHQVAPKAGPQAYTHKAYLKEAPQLPPCLEPQACQAHPLHTEQEPHLLPPTQGADPQVACPPTLAWCLEECRCP